MLTKLYVKGSNWAKSDEGATAVEYGLMVALIAAVIIAGATALGTNTQNVFNTVAGKISAA